MPTAAGNGAWWGIGRQRFNQAARDATPVQRASMIELCEKRAAEYATIWPALSASWQHDADLLREIGQLLEERDQPG